MPLRYARRKKCSKKRSAYTEAADLTTTLWGGVCLGYAVAVIHPGNSATAMPPLTSLKPDIKSKSRQTIDLDNFHYEG